MSGQLWMMLISELATTVCRDTTRSNQSSAQGTGAGYQCRSQRLFLMLPGTSIRHGKECERKTPGNRASCLAQ